MELLLFPNYVMYYRKRAFSAAQVGVQMEKILLTLLTVRSYSV